jgi:hypothetical protein
LRELVQRPALRRLELHHRPVGPPLAGIDEYAAGAVLRVVAIWGRPVASPRGAIRARRRPRDVDHLDLAIGGQVDGQAGQAAHAVEGIEEHLVGARRTLQPLHGGKSGGRSDRRTPQLRTRWSSLPGADVVDDDP